MPTFETYQEKTSSNLTVGLTVGIVAFAILTGLGIIYWRKYRAKTMGVREENSPSVPEIALPGVVSTKNYILFLSLAFQLNNGWCPPNLQIENELSKVQKKSAHKQWDKTTM